MIFNIIRFMMTIFITFSLVLGSPFYALAAEIGRITYVEGRADLSKSNDELAVPAREEMTVEIGDVIRTKSNSKAEITFKDKSVLRLAENSRVKIQDYQLDGENKRKTATIMLERGKIRTIIEKMADLAEFNIHTPNAHGTIKGSDIFAFYQAGNSGMLVSQGNLRLINPNIQAPPVMIPPGNSALVPVAEAPKGPRPYLELEKNFFEQDTNPPPTISRRPDATRIEGVVTKVSGDVKMTRQGSRQTAEVNGIIRMGDSLETGEDGMIELKFDNGNAVSLKPKTRMTMTKMVVDPRTREHETLLEVGIGQVKATVENLKGGSTFQVKTPQAISGVRGTLMYLIITSQFTKSFFEGGPGFVQSVLTGKEKAVPMGQSATADKDGSVSDPVPVLGDERLGFTEGWVPGSGIEGYSRPDGTPGEYFYDTGTSVQDVAAAAGEEGSAGQTANADDPNIGAGNNERTEIPITESANAGATGIGDSNAGESESGTGDTGGSGGGGSEPGGGEPGGGGPGEGEPLPIIGNFEAKFGRHNGPVNLGDFNYGSLTDELQTADPNFAIEKEINLTGTFSLPQAPNDDFDNLWSGTVEGEYADGTRFLGFIDGTRMFGGLDAMISAMYIQPGDGGFITGYLSSNNIVGNFNSSEGSFEAAGNLIANFDVLTSITPDQLTDGTGYHSESIIPGILSGDIFSGEVAPGLTLQLNDQEWGIWRTALGGTFGRLPDNNWLADVGGVDAEENTYWLGHLVGSSWQDGLFGGMVHGQSLDDTVLKFFGGNVLGSYDDENSTFEGLAQGVVFSAPLLFSGTIDGKFGGYSSGFFEDDISNGQLSANFGGLGLLFEDAGPSPMTIMGGFLNPGNYPLWATPENFSGQTFDGGALWGKTGGTNLTNGSVGLFNALYIRPDGQDGYLAGYAQSTDLTGKFYPGLQLFEFDGNINSFLDVPTDYSPSELLDGSVIEESSLIRGQIGRGDFSINGTLEVDAANIIDQNWGLWSGYSGGSFASIPNAPWEAFFAGSSFDQNLGVSDTFLFGSITGNALQNNQFSALMSGHFLSLESYGTITADFVGVYGVQGPATSWQGLSTGIYQTTNELFSSGDMAGGRISQFDDLDLISRIEGLAGFIVNSENSDVWNDREFRFVSIGDFAAKSRADLDDQRFNWYSVIRSNTHEFDNPRFITFPDGNGDFGAFVGLSAGIGTHQALFAKSYGIYADPNGNAGTFSGTLVGSYIDDVLGTDNPQDPSAGNYFLESLSNFTLNDPRSSEVDILGLVESLNVEGLTDAGLVTSSGSFNAGGTILGNDVVGQIYFLEGEEGWGIYGTKLLGTYAGATSNEWQLSNIPALTTELFPSAGTISGSWLGHVDGTIWQLTGGNINDNFLEGNLSALWIRLKDDGTLTGNRMAGEVIGTYTDVDEGSLWEATSVGEWVEVDDLLELSGSVDDVVALGTANVPVTEVYTTLLIGDGAFAAGGTITPVNFFIDFFTSNVNAANGIWASNINGNFIGPTGDAFTINANGNLRDSLNDGAIIGTVNATLTGTQWNTDKWLADVIGASDTGIQFAGEAAGTFDAQGGTFAGAGTGVWGPPGQ